MKYPKELEVFFPLALKSRSGDDFTTTPKK